MAPPPIRLSSGSRTLVLAWRSVRVQASRPVISDGAEAFASDPDDGTASGASGLVEEAAAFQETRALLGRHLDVSRRQQEDLVGDSLHAAVQGIGQTAREIDQTLGEILIRALEVQ